MTRPLPVRQSVVTTGNWRRWWTGFDAPIRRALGRLAPRLFVRYARPSRAELGLAGEELAARWLARRGWRLRGRRVNTPQGEVDLWAEREEKSWVIEVKTGRLRWLPPIHGAPSPPRWDLRWRPGQRIDRGQLRRLFRAARHLGRGCGRSSGVLLVEVLVSPDGGEICVLPPSRLTEDRPLQFAEVPR